MDEGMVVRNGQQPANAGNKLLYIYGLAAIHMKAFLLKYKRRIIFLLVFLVIVLYFAPRQNNYYLDNDIRYFKKHYLVPTLIWMGAVISVILLISLLINTKSIRQSLLSFLYGCIIVAWFLFIFQDLFLAAALFINRHIKKDSIQKTYVAKYLAGTDQTKENFNPYDISTGQISIDDKLRNKLYYPGLKQDDTIILKFDKGLFGIVYQQQPYSDK